AHDAATGDFLGFLPDAVRRGVEAWMDVAPPAPGEGSRWRLEYTGLLLGNRHDLVLAGPWGGAGGGAGVGGVGPGGRRRPGGGGAGRGRRWSGCASACW